jgi:hypothetical protein
MKSYPGFLRSPRFTASVSRCAASSAWEGDRDPAGVPVP